MVYRVVADDAIKIIALTPKKPDWYADHPFPNYPAEFPRLGVSAEPVEPEVLALLSQVLSPDGSDTYTTYEAGPIRQRLSALGYPFTQIGGPQFVWQGIPTWDCRTLRCAFAGEESDAGKEVFAVVWERPVPDLHLWTDDPEFQDVGSCQIIFSRCTGCGVIHSCNRCD